MIGLDSAPVLHTADSLSPRPKANESQGPLSPLTRRGSLTFNAAERRHYSSARGNLGTQQGCDDAIKAGKQIGTKYYVPSFSPNQYLTAYGFSTRRNAGDNAESYTSLSYSSPNNNGGNGFGAFTGYTSTSSSRGGIRLVTATSTNGTAGRFIDGAKSFSAYAGSSTTRGTHSGFRPLSNPGQFGTFTCSVRFDLDNSKGFTGLNLKSASGSTFAATELLSIGMMPANGALGGNQGILVTDAAGQRTVNLGSEARGSVIDFKIDFDTCSGSYTLGVKFRSNPEYITSAGTLKLTGPAVNLAAIGYINGNNSGASNQNFIFDSLAISTTGSAGSGVGLIGVSGAINGLAVNSVYHYRVVAQSAT
ncbi:MAG: hypothetical protein WCI74_15635, partial [Actinomycetes bacterium]